MGLEITAASTHEEMTIESSRVFIPDEIGEHRDFM
jgi:hypothetical protein